MVFTILFFATLALWMWCNLCVTFSLTAEQMTQKYITNQCFIGKVVANIFYMPAWGFKLLKEVIK